jgi:putative endonuclease
MTRTCQEFRVFFLDWSMPISEQIAWVYILTNEAMTVLYTGYTTALDTRLWEHRTKQNPNCFTARYNIYKLVYYRGFHSIESAQAVERQIKKRNRAWKIKLINSINPQWNDLTDEAKNL